MVRLDACEQCVRVCVRSRLYLQAIGNVREGIGDQVVQALDGLLGVARVAEVVELRRVAAPHLLGPEDAALDDVLEEVASDVGLSHSARGSSLERLRLPHSSIVMIVVYLLEEQAHRDGLGLSRSDG